MSYFVGILNGVENIFLADCSQVFSLWLRGILNHIKVESKEGNPLINNIDKNNINNTRKWEVIKTCPSTWGTFGTLNEDYDINNNFYYLKCIIIIKWQI